MTLNLDAADGRWPDILQALAGLSPDQLSDRHQPCPNCGGDDRYRWDTNDGPGGWFCNQCGGKQRSGGGGTGIDLLMRLQDWTFKQAADAVRNHLGITEQVTAQVPRMSQRRPSRTPETPPLGTQPPNLGRAAAQYLYTNAEGQLLFAIQRFNRDDGGKFFVHRTWLDGAWHFPRKADGFDSAWPTPRPLYRLPALKRQPYDDVVIVEGEKAADHAAHLLPGFAVLSWPNGSNAIDKVDWSPLAGRFVNLWPDNDAPGLKAMLALGKRLREQHGCTVNLIDIPTGVPDGWDVADSVWTPEETQDWVINNRKPLAAALQQPAEPEPDESADDAEAPVQSGKHFALLGFRGDDYFYLPKDSGVVTRLTRAGHTALNLNGLAPSSYWETLYPGRGGCSYTQAASDLFRAQHLQGSYNPDNVRGRGAWMDRGRTVLHLGESLVVDGVSMPLSAPLKTSYHYNRGLPLARLSHVEPLSDQEAYDILLLAERFNWEGPASAHLLSGWCALAPICGALPWRPHIWLTAGAGTGKSAILERFVSPLLGELQLCTQGSTTEAFIRQHLKTDALPVIMDEAESTLLSDQTRIQQILALARQASTESRAIQGRGSPSGESQVYRIRSMFLLASIATAVKGGADDRRFTQLTLKRPAGANAAEQSAEWISLKTDLERMLTETFSQRLLARMVSQLPQLRQTIATFTQACAGHFGTQAAGDQYGTLLAGAWHLYSSRPGTAEDCLKWANDLSCATYVENENVLADEVACLQTILETQLRVQNGDLQACDRTVLELVGMCDSPGTIPVTSPINHADAQAALGRVGLRVKDGRLLVANCAEGLKRILQRTPWASNWGQVLLRLPGAEKGGMVHFAGIGSQRSVSLPVPLSGRDD